MARSFLLLNDSKTAFMVFNAEKGHFSTLNEIEIGEYSVLSQTSARNLGALFDSNLFMNTHISNVCRSAYGNLRAIGRIRKISVTIGRRKACPRIYNIKAGLLQFIIRWTAIKGLSGKVTACSECRRQDCNAFASFRSHETGTARFALAISPAED